MKAITLIFLFCFSFASAQDTLKYCADVQPSESGGYLISLRVQNADSLLSMQFRVNWAEPIKAQTYFYHPNIPSSPFSASNSQPGSVFVSYFTQAVEMFDVPDGERLIQVEIPADPLSVWVDNIEFTKPGGSFLEAVPAIESCPIFPPPVEAEMIVNTSRFSLPQVLIYPNPSTGTVWFEADQRSHVRVFDVQGQVRWEGILKKGNILLRDPGFYYLISDKQPTPFPLTILSR